MPDLLEFRGVDTYYGDLHVLKSVDYRIGEGEIVCLLGGNASGKSTTLKTILGIVRPRAGEVLLDGQDVTNWPVPQRIARGLAIVPENRRLFGQLTVLENLELALRKVGALAASGQPFGQSLRHCCLAFVNGPNRRNHFIFRRVL